MNDNLTTEPMNTQDAEPVETVSNETVQPLDSAGSAPDTEPEGTSEADTVRSLRDELAKRRIKAREQVSQANERIALAYVHADGRLIDPDAFTVDDQLLGDDGFVDPARVTAAIDALLAAKPHLSARKPSTPITQGVQPLAPESPGLFTLIRERY